LALVLAGVACKSPSQPTSDTQVNAFISSVQTFDTSVTASQQSGQPPAPSGGPSATVSGNTSVSIANGGANAFQVNSTAPFSKVLVSVDTPAGASAAASTGFPNVTAGIAQGFFELTLPAGVTSQFIIIAFGSDIPVDSFTIQIQCVAPGGAVGAVLDVEADVLAEETTGSLQVTATWDAPSDVDLHLVEPNGFEIFWGQSTSPAGGQLNVDSNPLCAIDNINTENISYPNNQAPAGLYIVRLDYFLACNQARTNFVVTVNNGGQRSTFTGFFDGPGDSGAAGSGREITRFTRTVPASPQGFFTAPGPGRRGPDTGPAKFRHIRNRGGGGR
jgi:hypothetical protein